MAVLRVITEDMSFQNLVAKARAGLGLLDCDTHTEIFIMTRWMFLASSGGVRYGRYGNIVDGECMAPSHRVVYLEDM